MRLLPVLLIAATLLSACSASKKAGSKGKSFQFPEEFKGLEFNMSMKQVGAIRDLDSDQIQDGDFRFTVYEPLENSEIEGAGYYFDAEGDKPFYELIIVYKSEELRDAAAQKLLGEPNFENNTEWQVRGKGPYEIRAWGFKTKLIIAALIPNTEWYEDVNSKNK